MTRIKKESVSTPVKKKKRGKRGNRVNKNKTVRKNVNKRKTVPKIAPDNSCESKTKAAHYLQLLQKHGKLIVNIEKPAEKMFLMNARNSNQEPIQTYASFYGYTGEIFDDSTGDDTDEERSKKRNKRERGRVSLLNTLFKQLLHSVPHGYDLQKQYLKSTRIHTMVHAINYINALQHLLIINDPTICIDAQSLHILSHENTIIMEDQYDSIFKKKKPNSFIIEMKDRVQNDAEKNDDKQNAEVQKTDEANVMYITLVSVKLFCLYACKRCTMYR